MKLTIKVKHGLNLKEMMTKLHSVVLRALDLGLNSSKHFKDFGLPSTITSSTARKYIKQKSLKPIKSIKGVINNQAFKVDSDFNLIISCLKCSIKLPKINREILKFNQIEFDSSYFYIVFDVSEKSDIEISTTLGVDFNTKGNTVFLSVLETGLAMPLGVSLRDANLNLRNRIAKLQSEKKFKLANRLSRKLTRKRKDNLHKVSRKIVNLAVENSSVIVLEDLTGIRNSKCKKEFGKSNWSFYELRTMIEYKAKLEGVPVKLINPRNTSRTCSRCGHVHDKPISGKVFKCNKYGYVSHRDLNASFNISKKYLNEKTAKELDLVARLCG
jgi:putative transposase